MPATINQPRMALLIQREVQLPLIEHPVNGGALIPQQPRDGYIHATRLCQEAGKQFNDYVRLARTQAFLKELRSETGIPVSDLVRSVRGGSPQLQGTWVHPRVAINLGQWISPAFDVKVSKWIFDWMAGRIRPDMPVHVQRYLKNRSKVPIDTHFSMLNEIYLNLVAPLEDQGLILPDKMMPDISTGRMFSNFLRRRGIKPENFPTYEHEFADHTRIPVQALLQQRVAPKTG